MKRMIRASKLALTVLLFIFGLFLVNNPVYADTNTNANANLIPMQITPLCSDAATATTYWQVYNSNAVSVPVVWNTIDNNHTGSYNAPSGQSNMTSYYDGTDPNNTTQFIWEGQTTQTNAPAGQCNPANLPVVGTTPVVPPVTCIDGTVAQNLTVTELSQDSVEIQTLNDQPLCANVTVYLSSYIMPATYNGNGFANNPTATPQQLFQSVSATLQQGTDGDTTLTVALPDSCNNIQTDVYYAPEITTVTAAGHGSQYINGWIYPSTGSCTPVTPPNNGGNGGGTTTTTGTTTTSSSSTTPSNGGQVLAASTTVPAVAGTQAAQLANTGVSPVVPTILALFLMAAALAVARRQTVTDVC